MLTGSQVVAFRQTVSDIMLPIFQNKGSKLQPFCTPYVVNGECEYIRQFSSGEAEEPIDYNAPVNYSSVNYGSRRLMPSVIRKGTSLNRYEVVKQGGLPSADMLVSDLVRACGVTLDRKIFRALSGASYTKESGTVELGADNTITFDNNEGILPTMDGMTDYTYFGLNTAKLDQALVKLADAYADGTYFVVGSPLALSQLRSDPRGADRMSNFNVIPPGVSTGSHVFPGGWGFAAFVQLPGIIPTFQREVGGQVHTFEYAYAYAKENLLLGSNMPFELDGGVNAERGNATNILLHGMYDATRLQESGVVRFEIRRS